MTGQVKGQVLARAGELGVDVVAGHLRFQPHLVDRSEFDDEPFSFGWLDVNGSEQTCMAPAHSLAFTYCQVPVIYTLGREPSIEVERADGRSEIVPGLQLDRVASSAPVRPIGDLSPSDRHDPEGDATGRLTGV